MGLPKLCQWSSIMDIESYHLAKALRDVLCAYAQNNPVPIKKSKEGGGADCGNREALRVALENGWRELQRVPLGNFSEAYGIERVMDQRISSMTLWIGVSLGLVGLAVGMSSWKESGKLAIPVPVIYFAIVLCVLSCMACSIFSFLVLRDYFKLKKFKNDRRAGSDFARLSCKYFE